jgi:hypothetical protein
MTPGHTCRASTGAAFLVLAETGTACRICADSGNITGVMLVARCITRRTGGPAPRTPRDIWEQMKDRRVGAGHRLYHRGVGFGRVGSGRTVVGGWPGARVVLEAGGSDRRFFVSLPLGYGKLFYDPAVNWCYRTEPDPGLAGQRDFGRVARWWADPRRSMRWCGSGGIAATMTTGRPLLGRLGLGGRARRYRAIEDNEAGGDDLRGKGGPLFISANRAQHPLVAPFVAACAAAGIAVRTPISTGPSRRGRAAIS